MEINSKRNYRSNRNTWRLNRALLNNQWVINKIKRKKKLLKSNENANIPHQNLWDTVKAVQRWIFIAMIEYIKKSERCQVNNLMMHINILEKQEHAKPKIRGWKDIVKIRTGISERINKQRIGSLKK
jgi:hypothetical protein